MAFVFPKTWLGTTGDVSLVTNWLQDNIRNGNFRWVLSTGGGTTEYYLQTSAGASPGFVTSPPTSGGVYVNAVAATKGTVGSLAAGEWGFGDVDALGYDTIYLRLAGGTDPDLEAMGYVTFNQVPQTGEAVVVPEGSGAMTSNVDLSGTTLGVVTFENSNDNRALGSFATPIRLKCAGFTYEGGGQTPAYIDLTDSAISPEIRSTASADADEFGLYLAGSAVVTADIKGGSVGLGMVPGSPFVCTTGVRVRGGAARVVIGSTSTVPLLEALQGNVSHDNSIADVEVHGGTVRSRLAAAVSGVVTVNGGTWSDESSGTKASVVLNGGGIDTTQDGSPVIWSLFKYNAGTFRHDTDRLTISAYAAPDFPGVFSRARI